MADDKGDAACFQFLCAIGKAVEHERIVAGIGFGIAVHQAETHDDGQTVSIGPADRHFERCIPAGTLRFLHPVQDISARRPTGVFIEVLNSGVLYHCLAPVRIRGAPSGGSADRENRFEAGPVFFEPDVAVMELGDGPDQAEAEPAARRVAAFFQSVKAAENILARVFRHTGAAI